MLALARALFGVELPALRTMDGERGRLRSAGKAPWPASGTHCCCMPEPQLATLLLQCSSMCNPPAPHSAAELASSLAASPAAASSNIVPASPAAGRGIYRPRQRSSQPQVQQQQ